MVTLKVIVLKLHLKISTPISDPERKLPPTPSSLLIWFKSSYHLSPQAWPSHWNITAEIGHKQLHCTALQELILTIFKKIFSLASIRVLQQASYPPPQRTWSCSKARVVPLNQWGPTQGCRLTLLLSDTSGRWCGCPPVCRSGPMINNHVFSGPGP